MSSLHADEGSRRAGPRRARLRIGGLALLASLAPGCKSALETRVAELEVARERLELRVDELTADRGRLLGLEAAMAKTPGIPPEVLARIAALETQVLLLEEDLRRATRDPRSGLRPDASTAAPSADRPPAPGPRADAPAAPAGSPGASPTWIPSGSPGAHGAAPPAGSAVEVLSVGSGGLLLVRTSAGLERVSLRGVEPPARAAVYERDPALRSRHGEAWGPHTVDTDAAWEAARAHLEALLRDAGTVLLAGTPEDAPSRADGGAIQAWIVVTRPSGDPIDVNAAMLRDGFALAERGTTRDSELARLEAEARASRRGIFGLGR